MDALNTNLPTTMPVPSFPTTTTTTGTTADMANMPNQAQSAAWMQMIAADKQQANTIWMQMLADAQKQEQERMKIMRDTQTKIFEMNQESTNNWLGVTGKTNGEFCKAIMA